MFHPQLITFEAERGSLGLVKAPILLDETEERAVHISASCFATDLEAVTGEKSAIITSGQRPALDRAIIVGTVNSALVKSLQVGSAIDLTKLAGRWEAFATAVVEQPLPDVGQALVIIGSDKRGAVYGLYTISEQVGVSPWYFWADAPIPRHPQVFALPFQHFRPSPSVRYRGIFINDEAPALTGWVLEKFGSYNVHFYEKVFELLLRLKANFLWPAMWPGYPNPGNSFFADDPLNQKTAHDWGIVVSTSHHEPMQRALNEWLAINPEGSWSWLKNKEEIKTFMREGVERAKSFESFVTIGMRGDGDRAMPVDDPKAVLAEIIDYQRGVIADTHGRADGQKQVMALYKEVQGYFDTGLEVPDDVTLLFSDDNFGTVRRLPTSKEMIRRGRAGVYYHLEYVGVPRSYKWHNSNSCGRIWQQLTESYNHGADEIWVINVGDIKPVELPITFALRLAYDVDSLGSSSLPSFHRHFARGLFGAGVAHEIGELLDRYDRLMAYRKHEHIESTTFSLLNYNEAERIVSQWQSLLGKAEELSAGLPSSHQSCFFELVLHPIKASCIYTSLRVAQAKNRLYALQRRNEANTLAQEVLRLFDEDYDLSEEFHRLFSGKWNHIMRQPHYGYQETWHAPSRDMIEGLCYVQTRQDPNPIVGHMGVAVEGHPGVRPGLINEESDRTHPSRKDLLPGLTLPPLSPYGEKRRSFEIFRRGTAPFSFSISTTCVSLLLQPVSGRLDKGQESARVFVTVSSWDDVSDSTEKICIRSDANDYEEVHLSLRNERADPSFHGFVESDSCVSMEAAHFSRPAKAAPAYQILPFVGRSEHGAVAVGSQDDAVWLEYDLFSFSAVPEATITLYFTMTLDTDPTSLSAFALMMDSHYYGHQRLLLDPPETGDLPHGWVDAVQDGVWTRKFQASNLQSGPHILKYSVHQNNILLEKIVIDLGGVRESYLGPPESSIV